MEIKKLLHICLYQLICLSSLTAILLSCQGSKFPKSGHFSEFKIQTRSIASFDAKTEELKKSFRLFQDPKQMAMFCLLNSKKPKTCYNIHLQEKIERFLSKSNKDQEPKVKSQLKELFSFSQVSEQLEIIINKALDQHEEFVQSLINKRKSFCLKNSKKDTLRCLEQYLKRDTFTVLNKYQSKNSLNGIEYLYLKRKIQNTLQNKFSDASAEINLKRTI